MRKTVTFVFLALQLAAVSAQTLGDGERQRIASERAAAQTSFDLQDTACYKKFWVNNCLDDVKANRLAVMSDLRRQEVALNDQQRKAKGAEQLQKLEEKASVVTEASQQNERAEAVNKAQDRAAREAKKAAESSSSQSASQQKSQAEAQSRQERQTAKQARSAAVQSQAAGEAEKYRAKQEKAQARQAKKRAELDAQKTRKQGAPLPPVPAP